MFKPHYLCLNFVICRTYENLANSDNGGAEGWVLIMFRVLIIEFDYCLSHYFFVYWIHHFVMTNFKTVMQVDLYLYFAFKHNFEQIVIWYICLPCCIKEQEPSQLQHMISQKLKPNKFCKEIVTAPNTFLVQEVDRTK